MLDAAEMTAGLIKGAVLGGMVTLGAYATRRHAGSVLAGVLIFAAVGYIVFAHDAGKSAAWMGLEVLGLVIYGSMAIRGVFGSPWWLVAGWTLHPVWDGVLHYYGPGGAFAPTWWTVPCISWDLLTAGYIAWRIVRGTHPAPAGNRGEFPSGWRGRFGDRVTQRV